MKLRSREELSYNEQERILFTLMDMRRLAHADLMDALKLIELSNPKTEEEIDLIKTLLDDQIRKVINRLAKDPIR